MKIGRVVTLVGLVISFASPISAQQKDSVDPEVRQQIEAVLMKFCKASDGIGKVGSVSY